MEGWGCLAGNPRRSQFVIEDTRLLGQKMAVKRTTGPWSLPGDTCPVSPSSVPAFPSLHRSEQLATLYLSISRQTCELLGVRLIDSVSGIFRGNRWPQGAIPNSNLQRDRALTSGLHGAQLASYEFYDFVLSLSLRENTTSLARIELVNRNHM